MPSVILSHEADWDGWRTATRAHVLAGTPPDELAWSVGQAADLFANAQPQPPAQPQTTAFAVPRALLALAQTAIQHNDPGRFALLYRLVRRAHAGERHLLEMATDPEVHRASRLAQSVRRDTHKMRAFLRFRAATLPDGPAYVAWFEPDHHIVDANAPFFVRRFATMTWSILTPTRSAFWNGTDLAFGPGATRADLPPDDQTAPLWTAYFSSIFNPARLKLNAMTSEMPRKYWRNLPETAAIPGLVRTAAARTAVMVDQPTFSPPRPLSPNLPPPSKPQATGAATGPAPAIQACRRCPLWQPATQPVHGEGPRTARIMMVGEQPGDQEDLAGRPFIGPAGQVLDRAMAEAGLDRSQVFLTNAVKHFKFTPRGRRRIHARPNAAEIDACRFWLDLERAEIRPALIVMLGGSAARAVLGHATAVTRARGLAFPLDDGSHGFITVHPSYLLRLPDEAAKAREWIALVQDLRTVATLAAASR